MFYVRLFFRYRKVGNALGWLKTSSTFELRACLSTSYRRFTKSRRKWEKINPFFPIILNTLPPMTGTQKWNRSNSSESTFLGLCLNQREGITRYHKNLAIVMAQMTHIFCQFLPSPGGAIWRLPGAPQHMFNRHCSRFKCQSCVRSNYVILHNAQISYQVDHFVYPINCVVSLWHLNTLQLKSHYSSPQTDRNVFPRCSLDDVSHILPGFPLFSIYLGFTKLL